MKYLLILIFLLTSTVALADQAVMNMAPRWKDGYGFQLRYENFGSDKLRDGGSSTDNPMDFSRYVNETWLEGVYTFDRSKRVTFKLPYINQRRLVPSDGGAVRQKEEGLGDLIIGVPLKYYTNNQSFTSNLSFTPSLRIPTGETSGDFPTSDGSWDIGTSLSYSTETSEIYQYYDLFYWINTDGSGGRSEGDQFGFDMDLGIHPYHDNLTNSGVYVMLDLEFRHDERGDALTTGASGGTRLNMGPALVLYRENIMFRAEYKFLVHEDLDGVALSRGDEINVGIGMTF